MDLELNGAVAAVAGASKGMGREIARVLSQEGCRVGICARNEENVMAAASAIERETGNPVTGIAADVSKAEDVRRFIDTVAETYSGLNILVSNAGGPPSSAFETTDDDMWRETFDLTLQSAIRLSRAALPHLKAAGWGRILYIVSLSAKEPIDGLILSNAIRPGVLGLSKSISKEFAPYNILVNAVCPGYIATERLIGLSEKWAEERGTTPEKVLDGFSEKIPLRRLGTPREFADVILFLASKRASYLTGTVIQVDGGRCASIF